MSAAVARGHNPDPSAVKRRWRTPLPLFRATDERYGFHLDAAAEVGASLCPAAIGPDEDTLVTPWVTRCAPNAWGERWAWFNPPWGPKKAGFPGTVAFTRRALNQAPTLSGVVLLLPTAPDTIWWRELYAAASEVRLLPRVAFIDPDTLQPGGSPPGGGCTLFELRTGHRAERRVLLADKHGRV